MKTYTVRRNHAPTLDWSQAVPLTDFHLPWDDELPAPTEFRALWDDLDLHFRFAVTDHDLVLSSAATLKERVLDSDRVEIFFTPALSLQPYFGFEMSPQAEALIYSGRHYRQIDWSWTCPSLRLSAEISLPHYTVTGSLPLAALREMGVLKPDSREMLAGVFRADFSSKPDGSLKRRWMPWVIPESEKPDFHIPSAFGRWVLED